MAIGEAEYLEQRLDDQINWYSKKSAANQAAHKRLRLIEIIAAASIPLLAGYSCWTQAMRAAGAADKAARERAGDLTR
ncbi:MAG: DUF4231 domain-containing protein [Betaproteobacteria bacterium]|nr:DUF4231 domain-containing protein [Betaproteobacteria bacterium]MDH3436439.1 DUF4231 domain-containing protein [Betaproteobacteria bacterium]